MFFKTITLINYNHKKFRAVLNSPNGETTGETIFQYQQIGNILFSSYKGGAIIMGHLLGKVSENGHLNFTYHQINNHGELRTGKCTSFPEILKDGRIRLHEQWQWTNGDLSKGESIVEEIQET